MRWDGGRPANGQRKGLDVELDVADDAIWDELMPVLSFIDSLV